MKLKSKMKKYMEQAKRAILQSYYCHYLNKPINKATVFMESRNGNIVADNILILAKEMQNPEYKIKKIYLAVKKDYWETAKKLCETYHIQVNLIPNSGRQYYRAFATAKYLFTDTTFSYNFVKRDGQIIVNTWHGTPIKAMGKFNENERFDIGNVQRSFVMSDFILCQGDCIKERLSEAYMLKNIFPGKFLMSGFPRNSIFSNTEQREALRKLLGWENKSVCIYMPTFRGMSCQNTGRVPANEEQIKYIETSLIELDQKLTDNQLLVIKFHPFLSGKCNIKDLQHVVYWPDVPYLTYDILNCADALITDYSSVMYDFVNANRKIILWAYDLETYEHKRGLLEPITQLPFVIVKTIDELVKEMMDLNTSIVEKSQLSYYCGYDSVNASSTVCQRVFLGKQTCPEISFEKSTKENVLIFGGGLVRNGVTTSFLALLNRIDKNKRNYTLCFDRWNFTSSPLLMNSLPPEYDFIVLSNKGPYTVKEACCLLVLSKFEKQCSYMTRVFDKLYQRELKRMMVYPERYQYVLNFEGYQNYNIKLFQRMNCKRILWIHNDMVNLIKTRKELNIATEKDAYNSYDLFAPITEDIVAPAIEVGCPKDRIRVIHNCFDDIGTKNRALKEIALQNNSFVHIKLVGGIEEALYSPGIKIINIGRFSKEKEHMRLLKAFEQFYQTHEDAILFIIGGHGPLYHKTLNYVNRLSCWKNVVCIRNMENPLPILNKCDLFVLSSSFEGMPITIKEAAALNLPVVCTDIPGPHTFMNQYNGYLVEQTSEALYQGMLDFEAGKIDPLRIDFDLYNEKAVNEFESLFS